MPLSPLPNGDFRLGSEDWWPERLRFDAIVAGAALRADFSGEAYYRVPELATWSRGKRCVHVRAKTRASPSVTSSLVVTWNVSASQVISLVTSESIRHSPRAMPDVARKRTAAESGSPSTIE